MESISCQNQLILDAWRANLATKRRFYRPRLLWGYIRVIFCQEFGPSSARSALRWCSIQRARLRPSEMSLENASSRNVALRLFGNASSKMLRPGPFVCAGERKVVIAVFCPRRSTASVPWGSGRCGAAEFRVLDVAVDAMAAEQAEHERVQVQVQVRARMPLLPRRCRVLAGDSDYRVLHGVDVLLGHRVPKGVDVLGHCVKRGAGERLGNHVNQGFGGCCYPGAPALQGFVERCHHGASSLRALAAAMRIARKRNRSPQNGAGRDDGSSQRSLL